MIRKLKSEDDIQNLEFRKQVIKEITESENVARKQEHLKRYELYRDQIKKYVIESLQRDNLKKETLAQMSNRATSISICKKIVNKKARVYSSGVIRAAEPTQAQDQVDQLTRLLQVDAKGKKADRYHELHRNTMWQVIPEKKQYLGETKYCLKLRNFAPYQYDVIEDANDFEKPKVVILTDFIEGNQTTFAQVDTKSRTDQTAVVPFTGNHKDEAIADSPSDAGSNQRQFIWWSDKYHFTTDDHGVVIADKSPEDGLNPIGKLPFINIAKDQDGQFWAQGGDDLVDGSILLNVLATDMNSLAFIQGWGQLVITGKNIPQYLEGGPHNALIIEHDVGDPTPSVSFQSGNPPLEVWMNMIEQQAALLLSTNDLAPSTVSGKLDASSAASGIAMLIEQSEATGSIEDRQKMFQDAERDLWLVVSLWQNLLFETGMLEDEFMEVGKLPDDLEVNVKFMHAQPAVSEEQKLNALKLRKELGIGTMVDLIMRDNPDMSEQEAEEKLQKISAEKLSAVHNMITSAVSKPTDNQEMPEPEMQDQPNKEEPLN